MVKRVNSQPTLYQQQQQHIGSSCHATSSVDFAIDNTNTTAPSSSSVINGCTIGYRQITEGSLDGSRFFQLAAEKVIINCMSHCCFHSWGVVLKCLFICLLSTLSFLMFNTFHLLIDLSFSTMTELLRFKFFSNFFTTKTSNTPHLQSCFCCAKLRWRLGIPRSISTGHTTKQRNTDNTDGTSRRSRLWSSYCLCK